MARPQGAHPPHHHWRLGLATLGGAVVSAAAFWLGAPGGLASLMGWNVACVVFLSLTWWMFAADEDAVRMHAAAEDQGAPTMTALVLCAVAASLAATVLALSESKAGPHTSNARLWPLALSVSTLMMSWLVIQTVFTLRYAHAYFGDGNRDGEIDGGVEFPGDPPTDYRSFIYMAVCVGCTSQVSDFNILTNDFRSLVTTHAVVSFAFNVSVLALGINMAASVLGQ
jgi:uncharacterized membrane protein